MAQIWAELRMHVVILYNWRMSWRLQGEVLSASQKDPEGWGATYMFTVVLQTAGLNITELSAYCRERTLNPEQVERGGDRHQASPTWPLSSVPEALDANEKPVLT